MTSPRRRATPSGKRALIEIKLPKFPQLHTITVLALGFLIGNFLFLPMIALVGQKVPEDFRDNVQTTASLFKDGMLLILGYYFRDKQNPKEPVQE